MLFGCLTSPANAVNVQGEYIVQKTCKAFLLSAIVFTLLSGPFNSFNSLRAQEDEADLTAKVVKEDLKIEIEIPGVFIAEDKEEIAMEPK